MSDPFQRFVDAQATVYDTALDEIRRGRKVSHWMWFVFPQLEGLGRSPTARHFALASLDEARSYLAHPLLGARFRECAGAVAAHAGGDAHAIFGSPDDLKLRSSLTLFEQAASGEPVFRQALEAVCGGRRDPATLSLLAGGAPK